MIRCLVTLVFVGFSFGCQHLPPGDVSKVEQLSELTHAGNVYMLRGWQDLYSTGIDELARELETKGVRSAVFRETQWSELADALITRYRGHSDPQPFVVIGFSYGADNVVALSRKLNKAGVAVPLLITIDPVTPDDVPDNVAVCYNFYQSNGAMDALPFFRGIPLKSEKEGNVKLMNINIHDRPDLDDPNVGHRTIAASPKVRAAIIAEVLRVCPPRAAATQALNH